MDKQEWEKERERIATELSHIRHQLANLGMSDMFEGRENPIYNLAIETSQAVEKIRRWRYI